MATRTITTGGTEARYRMYGVPTLTRPGLTQAPTRASKLDRSSPELPELVSILYSTAHSPQAASDYLRPSCFSTPSIWFHGLSAVCERVTPQISRSASAHNRKPDPTSNCPRDEVDRQIRELALQQGLILATDSLQATDCFRLCLVFAIYRRDGSGTHGQCGETMGKKKRR